MLGAGGTTARERALLYRMAWDMAGSALGNRTELYERFYLASSARMYQVAHFAAAQDGEFDLLDDFIANLETSSADLSISDRSYRDVTGTEQTTDPVPNEHAAATNQSN
jgi:4-hydroxyphenylacetate 3-hydroxylase family.